MGGLNQKARKAFHFSYVRSFFPFPHRGVSEGKAVRQEVRQSGSEAPPGRGKGSRSDSVPVIDLRGDGGPRSETICTATARMKNVADKAYQESKTGRVSYPVRGLYGDC